MRWEGRGRPYPVMPVVLLGGLGGGRGLRGGGWRCVWGGLGVCRGGRVGGMGGMVGRKVGHARAGGVWVGAVPCGLGRGGGGSWWGWSALCVEGGELVAG